MLTEIHISALGVIADATAELGPGLTVVTGETGAGKTMVVQGLALLLGARADSGAVRSGASAAIVEGRWRVDPDGPTAQRIREAGGQLDDDELIVVRSVTTEGRSRAHAGGRAVPVGVLGELAEQLVALHGQSDQQRLLRPDTHRRVLDRYAGELALAAAAACAALHERYRAIAGELDELHGQRREREREADRLRFGLGEVQAVAPVPGEDTALTNELDRLEHADLLRGAAMAAHGALTGDEDLPDDPHALGSIAGARRALDHVREHDGELAALAERVAEAGYLLADAASDLGAYAAAVAADPAALEVAQQRKAALAGLTRKYGADIDDVLAWAREAEQRLALLDGSDERIAALEAEAAAVRAEFTRHAAALTAERNAAAGRIAAAVADELAALAMPHAAVTVSVNQREHPDGVEIAGRRVAFGPHGVDDVELLLAANPGAPARPLAKGASGGELSRVMLAIEAVLGVADPVPTFVFDEVDAGVGGRAAVEIGRRLARLARTAQVIVVTHLPQVAAYADRHLVVRKDDSGAVTTSGVELLDAPGRVRELSRMLAGLESSALARGHAEELLASAAEAKAAAG